MARPIAFRIRGIEAIQKKFGQLPKDLKQAINDEFVATGKELVQNAVHKAPANDGFLRQHIEDSVSGLHLNVTSFARYSAFVEFGTGGRVSVPQGYEQYAAQFKGKAGFGSWDDFIKSLTEWVRKKGLAGTYRFINKKTGKPLRKPVRNGSKASQAKEDERVAYAIAVSIMKNGLKPHPFLIPAYKEATAGILLRITKRLKDAGY